MIPKIIHKIWIGSNEDKLKFSDSWLKHFPDYELKIWNNETLKPYFLKMQDYLGEMPKCNFTFASDTLRLLIINDYGGIYLDHDVEILRNFEHLLTGSSTFLTFQYPECDNPPEFLPGITMKEVLSSGGDTGSTSNKLYKDNYCGDRLINKNDYLNACFIASEPNSPVIKKALELYYQNYWASEKEKYPLSDWACGPQVVTRAAEYFNIVLNGKTQSNKFLTVFQRDMFHPLHGVERLKNQESFFKQIEISKERSYAIHHHAFTNMKKYLESIYKSQEDFHKEAHAFTIWYYETYKNEF